MLKMDMEIIIILVLFVCNIRIAYMWNSTLVEL